MSKQSRYRLVKICTCLHRRAESSALETRYYRRRRSGNIPAPIQRKRPRIGSDAGPFNVLPLRDFNGRGGHRSSGRPDDVHGGASGALRRECRTRIPASGRRRSAFHKRAPLHTHTYPGHTVRTDTSRMPGMPNRRDNLRRKEPPRIRSARPRKIAKRLGGSPRLW